MHTHFLRIAIECRIASEEYDFEDAQIVDSNLTEEEIKVFQRKRAVPGKAEDPEPSEPSGPMRFQAKRKEAKEAKEAKEGKEGKEDSQSAAKLGPKKDAKKADSNYAAGLSKKKQRLSFDEDE